MLLLVGFEVDAGGPSESGAGVSLPKEESIVSGTAVTGVSISDSVSPRE